MLAIDDADEAVDVAKTTDDFAYRSTHLLLKNFKTNQYLRPKLFS
jgi:hypothetical protein